MKIRNEKSIATIYDAVSILKGLDIINGSLKQNYYAESALFVPDRFINPLILRPKIDISDPSGSIPNGDKVDELSRLEWFENGVKINSNDDFKIEGANLTVFKNSEEPFEISYKAEWFDSRKKQVITIEDSVVVSCISLAQSDANVTMSLSKPQNWVHNPLKGERIYTINAYVSKDKVHESAVEWYYVDGNKKDKLIDSSCSFYVEGQYTNALKVDSAYMDNVIIKAKNISNVKLKEVYWFFDKYGNPVTHKTPEKTEVKGANVFSLPSSPTVAKLDYRIEGLTLEQLIKNGDFSDGLEGWTANVVNAKHNDDGYITCTIDAKTNFNGLQKTASGIDIGDNVYVLCVANFPKESFFDVRVGTYINSQKAGVGKSTISNISNVKGDTILRVHLQASNSGYEVGDKFDIYKCFCINLTQTFGAGNEPSKEWCDEHIQGYFEGIKSVQTPMRIKSTGANLFDMSAFGWKSDKKTKVKQISDTELEVWNDDYYFWAATSKPIKNLKEGNKYYVYMRTKLISEKGMAYAFLDTDGKSVGLSTGVFVEFVAGKNNSLRLGATDGDSVGKARFSNIIISDDKNTFERYKESNLYLNNNIELKSVGESKDYIENGKLYRNTTDWYKMNSGHVVRNREKDGFWIYDAVLSNIGVPNQDSSALKFSIINKTGVKEIFEGGTTSSTWGNGRNISFYTKLDSVDAVKKELENNDYYVSFEKSKTEVINLSTKGSLTSYPNGTIFIDNAIQLEEQYQDGITIKEDYPIQVLESIKVGKKYLDVSKAVVKDNLITHPDIANGDNVTIEYIYDENPIRNTNSIAYLVLEDILDEFWLDNVYTYKITDGEWELVKVTDISDYEEWLKTEKISPHTLAPDGVIFGTYEAETKFLRQYPSSLYVDIIAPTRLKEGITQIKARALVGTADGVIENPSKYFDISWYKKSNKAGASDVIIGEGEELTIDVADVDRIGIEIESKAIKE